MQTINTNALTKAVTQLEQGFEKAQQHPNDELMRDGAILHFKYTLDLSWKLIQRYLKFVIEIDEPLIYSKKDLFREAVKLKLIDDAETWITHYNARNQTAHDYDRDKANQVYEQAKLFRVDVKTLLKKFEELLS